jgi:hypothetical protein
MIRAAAGSAQQFVDSELQLCRGRGAAWLPTEVCMQPPPPPSPPNTKTKKSTTTGWPHPINGTPELLGSSGASDAARRLTPRKRRKPRAHLGGRPPRTDHRRWRISSAGSTRGEAPQPAGSAASRPGRMRKRRRSEGSAPGRSGGGGGLPGGTAPCTSRLRTAGSQPATATEGPRGC